MAKSLRSKTKRAFRSKKREEGVYAAAAAARLHRLNAKLHQATKKDLDGDILFSKGEEENLEEPAAAALDNDSPQDQSDTMTVDTQPKKVSTHGRRDSRREEWRRSKNLPPHPARREMNRQGGIAARRKAGRSQRRR